MRLLLAGLTTFGITTFTALIALGPLEGKIPTWLAMILPSLVFFPALLFSLYIFNDSFPGGLTGTTLQELEARGEIESTDFRAVRAIEVEEYEDEGQHFFLQLEEGGVLFLSGQYLYDYGTPEDDFEPPDLFPTTDFTVKRVKDARYVIVVVSRGEYLEPEEIGQFDDMAYLSDAFPEDGDVLPGLTLEDVKRLWLKG